MWRHRTLGFIVSEVEFVDGWAKFINDSIEDFMEEEKFRQVYDEVKLVFHLFTKLINIFSLTALLCLLLVT